MTQLEGATEGGSHWRSVGNILTFRGLERAIVLEMGILLVPFQTLYWATAVISEDQGLHKIVLEWESYDI